MLKICPLFLIKMTIISSVNRLQAKQAALNIASHGCYDNWLWSLTYTGQADSCSSLPHQVNNDDKRKKGRILQVTLASCVVNFGLLI